MPRKRTNRVMKYGHQHEWIYLKDEMYRYCPKCCRAYQRVSKNGLAAWRKRNMTARLRRFLGIAAKPLEGQVNEQRKDSIGALCGRETNGLP